MKTSFWTKLFDVISPRSCAICGRRLSPNEQVLCAVCHLHLPATGYERKPLDNPLARLFWGIMPVERAAALFFYEPKSEISQLIFDMKYRSRPEVGEAMGELTALKFAAKGFFEGIDAIVPMPITRLRQWKRGYNQSMMIARGVSNITGLPIYNNVVKRTRFSESQTKKSALDRLRNVDGVFHLSDAERIADKHILLIDDIITTGATVSACGRELAKAHGVSISILSLGMTKS
jgi:ComF family protein